MIENPLAKEMVKDRLEVLFERRAKIKKEQGKRGTSPGIQHTNEALIEEIDDEVDFLEDLLGLSS